MGAERPESLVYIYICDIYHLDQNLLIRGGGLSFVEYAPGKAGE